MPLKSHKPTTPSRRHMVLSDFSEITKSTPERSLLKGKKNKAGRNSAGRISVRHRGGGHKRRYRVIDFRRDKFGIPAKVQLQMSMIPIAQLVLHCCIMPMEKSGIL